MVFMKIATTALVPLVAEASVFLPMNPGTSDEQ